MLENIQFRLAEEADYPALYDFYRQITDGQKHEPYGANWHLGIYPCEKDLHDHIVNNEFHIAVIDGKIVSAAVLTAGDDPIYQNCSWNLPASQSQICILHLFATLSSYRGTGLSAAMMNNLISQARKSGRTVMRLDVVSGNVPAEKFYIKNGFHFVDNTEVYYDDTGNLAVSLYELQLQ